MKQSIIKIFFAAILAAITTVCGADPINPPSSYVSSVAYGNISLPEGNTVSLVQLYKVGEGGAPPTEAPSMGHVYANGDYFVENIEPGKYLLMGFMVAQDKFNFNYRGLEEAAFIKESAVEVKPGSATYMGSFDVKGNDPDFMKSSTVEIMRSKSAIRMLILKHLRDESKGTGWDTRFEKAMK